MAEVGVAHAELASEAQAAEESTATSNTNSIVFQGTARNMAVAIAMFATAALAFSMDLTHVFFARATAWTFVIWGALLLYGNLIDVYQFYEVTDEALIIRNPVRFLQAKKVWLWSNVQRMDLLVKRTDAEYQDGVLQIYHQEPGELTIDREDRVYDPELARLIIEHAGLKPVESSKLPDLINLPKHKATYNWTTSGRLAAG